MTKKLLKFSFYFLLVVIVLFIAFGTTVYIKYKNIENANIKPELLKTSVFPQDRVSLGEPVTVSYKLKIPWDKKPTKLIVSPGKGSQQVGKIKFHKIKYEWGFIIWQIKCNLQPFVNGEIPGNKAELVMSPDKDGNTSTLSLNIPKLFSKEIQVKDGKLNIAGTITEKGFVEKNPYLYYIIAIIIIILILAFLHFFFIKKKRSKSIFLSSWEEALVGLAELKKQVKEKILNSEKSISSLTDIVRNYLQARFNIHAPQQTTEEFLKDMEGWQSPLNNQDRNFLREFMVTADMIKFAKFDASEKQIMSAIDRAEELINKTIPNKENQTEEEK